MRCAQNISPLLSQFECNCGPSRRCCNDFYGSKDAIDGPDRVFKSDQVVGDVPGRDGEPQVVQELLQVVHVGPEAQGTNLSLRVQWVQACQKNHARDESLKALEFWLFQYRFCAPKAATAKHAFYVKQGPHEALMTWYDRLYDAAVYAFSYHQEGSPLKQLFMEDIQHQKPTSKLLLSLSRKSCSTSFWPKHKTKRKEQTVQNQVHGWLEESDLCPLPPHPQWIRPYGNTLNLNWTGYCHPIKV